MLVDIVNKLVEKYDITIFTIYAKGELEKELDSRVHIINMYNKKYIELSKKERILIPLSVLLRKKRIFQKYIDNKEYNAQIAFLEGSITRIFSVKSSYKVKKIAWIHNDMSKVFGRGIKSKIKRIIDRNSYEKYNNLVFVSIDNLDKFNKVYDDMLLPHEKVINNYINKERILELSEDLTEYQNIFNKEEVNILQVSRVVKQKAIDRLINVHAKLIKEGLNHHIYIIGEGPEKQKIEKMIKDLNVENTFTLLGVKRNPYPYVKNVDAFCLFSNFEGYPMVVEEAKILHKYIMVTNTSSREVLLDYGDYSSVVENSEEGIEKALREFISNKDRILSKKVEYIYTNEKIIDKIVKVIEEEGEK